MRLPFKALQDVLLRVMEAGRDHAKHAKQRAAGQALLQLLPGGEVVPARKLPASMRGPDPFAPPEPDGEARARAQAAAAVAAAEAAGDAAAAGNSGGRAHRMPLSGRTARWPQAHWGGLLALAALTVAAWRWRQGGFHAHRPLFRT